MYCAFEGKKEREKEGRKERTKERKKGTDRNEEDTYREGKKV
jgi:hypothetical protein